MTPEEKTIEFFCTGAACASFLFLIVWLLLKNRKTGVPKMANPLPPPDPTTDQWLSRYLSPHDYRLAIDNIFAQNSDDEAEYITKARRDSFASALRCAFTWRQSKEGPEYWRETFERACVAHKLVTGKEMADEK